MRRFINRPLAGVLVGALGLVACTSHQASTAPGTANSPAVSSTPPATWHDKMQALSQTLSSLLPLVTSRSKFNDPKNQAVIDADLGKIRSLAHSLKSGNTPNADPSLQMMSGLFMEDLDRASESLRGGNRDYARQILKDTTSYCIQCHTQTNNGPDFPRLSLNINTNELTSIEQAEFFAATRQFDRALDAYQKVLADKTLAKTDPFAWEQAARSALAIDVRVKGDAKDTAQLLSRIEALPSLPESTRQSIKSWKVSVKDWSKEKPTPLTTAEQILTKSEQLITFAQKHQEFPLDHSQDIPYFRASSLLHDLLSSQERSPEISARALYWAGVASEATRDMNFWTLHETYYEQCIRILPHSSWSVRCFDRLQDSITIGYSGSSGTKIPPEVEKRLQAFKELAKKPGEAMPPSDSGADGGAKGE